jgi:polyphosphate kinase
MERPAHKASLQEIFDLSLSDETTSWRQSSEKWVRVAKNADGEPLQDLQSVYIKRYRKTH